MSRGHFRRSLMKWLVKSLELADRLPRTFEKQARALQTCPQRCWRSELGQTKMAPRYINNIFVVLIGVNSSRSLHVKQAKSVQALFCWPLPARKPTVRQPRWHWKQTSLSDLRWSIGRKLAAQKTGLRYLCKDCLSRPTNKTQWYAFRDSVHTVHLRH